MYIYIDYTTTTLYPPFNNEERADTYEIPIEFSHTTSKISVNFL